MIFLSLCGLCSEKYLSFIFYRMIIEHFLQLGGMSTQGFAHWI